MGAGQSGFSEEEPRRAGLAQAGKNGLGSLITGFEGPTTFRWRMGVERALASGTAHEGGTRPKYRDTSENELHHKDREPSASTGAQRAGASARFVLVEGYTDVLALHQTGIREAVAIMGTAFTQDQLSQVIKAAAMATSTAASPRARRRSLRPGSDAARIRLAEERGLELQRGPVPEGTDPAELVSSAGAGRLRRATWPAPLE